MIRYNILNLAPPQVSRALEAPAETTKSARWPHAWHKSRVSTVAVGAAILLHVGICTLVLTIVRLPAVPEPPEPQAVTMVFAPEPAPAPPTPAAPPEPPAPAALPPPPESPPPPVTETQPPEVLPPIAPPPVTRPPIVRKTPPRPRPVAPPPPAETPAASQPQQAEAPAAQPAPPAPAVEAPIPGEWQHSLASWLAAHKTYPELARRRGIEGIVALRFKVERSGRVLDVTLARSSGSPTLDSAAEAMVRNAALPPFTAGMSQDTVTITVQIRYALTN